MSLNLIPQKDGLDAIRATNAIRGRLAAKVEDMVKHPEKYPATDLMDAIRDEAKAHGLSFHYRADPKDRNILHLYVWDPAHETPNFSPTAYVNPQWVASVVRGT